MNANTSTASNQPQNTHHGLGSKIKGALNVVHGIGDSVRGQILTALDDSPSHRELANKGRLETERGMDAFHKHPTSTNNRLAGYNNAIGNGNPAGQQQTSQMDPRAPHQFEDPSTYQGQQQQQQLEPQRFHPSEQPMTSSHPTNGAGYPPPPPHTLNGSPIANQDELLAAKGQPNQGSVQLGPEIPSMYHDSDAQQPHPNTMPQAPHQYQQHQVNPTQAPSDQPAMQSSAPYHHRDDAVMNADPNAVAQRGGAGGGPHFSTQDKFNGTVNQPSYQENPEFSMGHVQPGNIVPGTAPNGTGSRF